MFVETSCPVRESERAFTAAVFSSCLFLGRFAFNKRNACSTGFRSNDWSGPVEDDSAPSNRQIFSKNSRKRREDDEQTWEDRLQENWENCTELNLSYQDLGDAFQLENFRRILRRLIRVERLQLVDNALCDLSSIRLPRCKSLNLHQNHLKSLAQLPKIPAIEHLCVSENNIRSLAELKLLEHTPLHTLTLKHNPCEFLEDYRSRVFSYLPNLKVLDGIPKLPEDSVPLCFQESSRLCIIL
ncbi:protein tilB homolog isoform X3 [Ictalurus furcatus]|nr:protein tilB homolog isoform X3 [Ictalurus furcatus]XP_053479388.1 protein tilB homolog isoform X3 [Ictalurus furcatus]